jgi:F5/8 type C domain/Fibronectin type III domain
MIRVRRTLGLIAILGTGLAALVYAFELPPGRLTNPDGSGLQYFMSGAYNSEQDEYIITYEGGAPYDLRLNPTTNAIIGSQVTLGPDTNVQDNVIAYSPNHNEYLAVWRSDSPSNIFARYLDGNGQPLGAIFSVGTGSDVRVQYNPVDDRYIITYFRYTGPTVYYRMVDGDSTSSPHFLTGEATLASGLSPRVAYSSASNKFLVTYVVDSGPPVRADVRARFVTGQGTLLPVVVVAGGTENQQIPEIGYCASQNLFMIQFEDWSTGGFPNVSAQFVSASSQAVVGKRFNTTPGDTGWNVPGPVTCNDITGKFVTTQFVAVYAYAREVDISVPTAPKLGPNILVSDQNAFPTGIASRPDPFDPQTLVVWRNSYGADGVHASIIHLPPPPPTFISNQMPTGYLGTPYSERIPVGGGHEPLTYLLVSGAANVPPGLTGPDGNGKFNGTPTMTGTFGPFRVRVTDADAKTAEQDLFQTITLAAPTPVSPTTSTNDTTPTFSWSASPGATSYNLVVDNLTDGGTPINQSGIAGTSLTPITPLTPGKLYRWKVRATDGVNFSAFSTAITFEVDTTAPAAVTLTGKIPLGGTVQLSGLVAASSSGDEGVNTKDKSVDTDLATYWSTPGRATMQNEQITIDLGAAYNVRKVRLRSRSDNGAYFPKDFQIQVSPDNSTFTTVDTETNFSATSATWYSFSFASSSGRYVRILTTKSNLHPSGFYFVQLAEIEADVDGFIDLTGLTAIASSGDSGSNTRDKVLDKNFDTYWSTPGRASIQTEFLTLNLGAAKSFARVRMRSRADNGTFFPRDFEIQVSDDDASYTTVASRTDFSAGNGQWYDFDFDAQTKHYVRVRVTKSRQHSSGSYFTQIAEIEVKQGVAAQGTIELDWLAPGDDGTSGTAASYDIRYQQGNTITFASATSATGEPTPSSAGTPESYLKENLLDETAYTFQLRSSDEAGNLSPLSAPLTIVTLGIPPAAVNDLTATPLSGSSIRLDWHAVGDDGSDVGTATAYDIRYSTSPIVTAADFNAATQVTGEPAPVLHGTAQAMNVIGLDGDKLYYFAMIVIDDVGNLSPVSNVASAQTLDTAPPAAIVLSASPGASQFNYTQRNASAIAASGESGSYTRDKAVDGNLSTYWGTPGRATMQPEFITLDFGVGNVYDVGRVRMCARSDNGAFFPRDFQVQLSTDNTNFSSGLSVTNFTTSAGACTNFDLPPGPARYVRIYTTRSNQHSSGLYFVQIAEITLFEATAVADGALLSWTAPGDSGNQGTATSYDIRYALSVIDNDTKFNAASQVLGEPSPQPAGSLESFLVTGLASETTYFFAIKAADEVPNVSPLSNSPSFVTPGVAPAAVTTLAAAALSGTQIRLDWTSVGDDGLIGTATAYDVRYSTSPISNSTEFAAATAAVGEPAPKAPGMAETMTVSGLAPDTLYYFAMTVLDEVANASPLSNLASARTNDTAPPATIVLAAQAPPGFLFTKETATAADASGESGVYVRGQAVDGNASTYWGTPGRGSMQPEFITLDFGATNVFNVGRVRMCARSDNGAFFPRDFQIQLSLDGSSFSTAATVTNFTTTPGACTNFDFAPGLARFVKVYVTRSNQHSSGLYFVQIAEIELYHATAVADGALLTWTAPGDSGNLGTASSYDIRYSTSIIDNNTKFNAAAQATGEPVPQPAGSPEFFLVTGLTAETQYFFAIKASDEVPNVSALSNSPGFTTPGIAPAAVSDLAATPTSGTQVHLTWTAVGDDGATVGTATAYDVRYSASPITSATEFAGATQVAGEPAPQVHGSSESMNVTGLDPDSQYYFAMTVLDEVANVSPVSNLANARTNDTVAPAAIVLAAEMPTEPVYTERSSSAIDSSGNDGANVRTNAVDGDPGTIWSSPGRSTMQTEFLTLDFGLGTVYNVGRVRMCARADNGAYFPRNFQVQLSTDNMTYTTAAAVNNFLTGAGVCTTFEVTPGLGRFVRILVTRTNKHPSGYFFAQIAEVQLFESTTVTDGALLTWTAPGDSGGVGTAASYDIRYSTTGVIDTDLKFNAATQVSGEPTPQAAGSAESFLVNSLPSGTIFFAIKASDEVPNVSALSSSPSVVIP